ncbi:MAG TPA: hypothetical protein VM537_12235 [Anaerolineae bacterium]|nr:hypothetical protein [Anaerolineae bacterium]
MLSPVAWEAWEAEVEIQLSAAVEAALAALWGVLGEVELGRAYRHRFSERESRNYRSLAYEIIAGGRLAALDRSLVAQVRWGSGHGRSYDWQVHMGSTSVNCEVRLIEDRESYDEGAAGPQLRYGGYDPRSMDMNIQGRIALPESKDIYDKLKEKIGQFPPDEGPNAFILFHESADPRNLRYVGAALFGGMHFVALSLGQYDRLDSGEMSCDAAYLDCTFERVSAVAAFSPYVDQRHGDLRVDGIGLLNPRAMFPMSREVLAQIVAAIRSTPNGSTAGVERL